MSSVLFYLSVFAAVFAINCFAARAKNKKARFALVVLSFSILLLLIGLRYKVGTDYEAYLNTYKEVAYTPWDKLLSLRIEILPAIFLKVFSILNLDARFIFFLFGALTLYPIYRVNKLSNYKYLPYSVLIFCLMFLPFDLNGMRQGVAMSFALLSYAYLTKNKTPRAVTSILFAALFHSSALLILPYLVIYYVCKKAKKRFSTISMALSILVAALVLFFLNDILLGLEIKTYSYILEKVNVESITFSNLLFQVPAITLMLLPGNKKLLPERVAEKNSLKSLVCGGILFETVGTSARYLSRFSLYFLIFEVMLFPRIIQDYTDKNTRTILKIGLVIFLITYFIIQFYVQGRHEIFPYQTWAFEGGGL